MRIWLRSTAVWLGFFVLLLPFCTPSCAQSSTWRAGIADESKIADESSELPSAPFPRAVDDSAAGGSIFAASTWSAPESGGADERRDAAPAGTSHQRPF